MEENRHIERRLAVKWATPVLTELGSLSFLTASGSNTRGENIAECDFWGPGMHGNLCKNMA